MITSVSTSPGKRSGSALWTSWSWTLTTSVAMSLLDVSCSLVRIVTKALKFVIQALWFRNLELFYYPCLRQWHLCMNNLYRGWLLYSVPFVSYLYLTCFIKGKVVRKPGAPTGIRAREPLNPMKREYWTHGREPYFQTLHENIAHLHLHSPALRTASSRCVSRLLSFVLPFIDPQQRRRAKQESWGLECN